MRKNSKTSSLSASFSISNGKTVLVQMCECRKCRAARSKNGRDSTIRKAMQLATVGMVDDAIDYLLRPCSNPKKAKKRLDVAKNIAQSYERNDLSMKALDRLKEINPKASKEFGLLKILDDMNDHDGVLELIKTLPRNTYDRKVAIAHSLSHFGEIEESKIILREVACSRSDPLDWHALG